MANSTIGGPDPAQTSPAAQERRGAGREETGARPRRPARPGGGLPLFAAGFRPFFLGGAAYAALALPLWLLIHAGLAEPPLALPGWLWHAHEMLFGYLAAVISGFLLTAIPNWTGRLPISGRPLCLLFLLWLAGRLAMALGAGLGPIAFLIDALFLLVFAGVVWREVLAGRNLRNLPVCLLITCLAAANVGFHLLAQEGDAAVFLRAASAVAALLIALVGGRVVPSFTRNWLAKRGAAKLPRPFGAFDGVALAVTGAALLFWILPVQDAAAGLLLLGAGLLQALRLLRWQGWQCGAEPLVLVLHVAYGWLPLSLILLGLAALDPGRFPPGAGLHALTTGAVGLMTLAIMTRATLGHSGRALTANRATSLIYLLILAGALWRVLAPWLPLDYALSLAASGALWSAGFLGFVLVYGPMLMSLRES